MDRVVDVREAASLLNQHDAFFEEPLSAPRDYQSLALRIPNAWVVLDIVFQMMFPDFQVRVHCLGTDSTAGSIVRVSDASEPISPMSASARSSGTSVR